MRVAWLVAVVLLAGCFGDGGGGPTSGPTGTTGPTPAPTTPVPTPPPSGPVVMLADFHFRGCQGVSVEMWVEPAAAQAALPDGYAAQVWVVNTPATGVPTGRVQVTTEIYRCAMFENPVRDYEDVWFGLAAVAVEPPEGGVQGVAYQRYIVEMLTAGGILELLWPAAGLATYNDTAALEDPSGLGTWAAALGDYEMAVTAPYPMDQGTYPFVLYHESRTGRITWTGNESSPALALGQGTLVVPTESPMMGPRAAAAPTMLGRALAGESFTDMRMVRG